MGEPWTVIVEGDPKCQHQRPEFRTLTVIPPIPQVRCLDCGRLIQGEPSGERASWPEADKMGEAGG